MHPILVVNWIDWISYINSSTTTLNSLINFKSVLKSFNSEKSKRRKKKNPNLFNNNRTSSNRNKKRKLEHTYLVSLVIPLVYLLINLASIIKRKLCFHYIFMFILLIALDYFIHQNLLISATAINLEIDSKEKDQLDKSRYSRLTLNTLTSKLDKLDKLDIFTNGTIQINSLSFKNTTNSIRSNSLHSKKNQSRLIRSIKLTNHRLKHRRSSLDSNKSYQNAKHLTTSATKTNNWSVLGDQEAEYALKLLESEHLTSAILHFIEITYKYSELNLPKLQQENESKNLNSTIDSKKTINKYYNTGSCVQVKLDSLKGLLKSKSFHKYFKQTETARRTASLLTTLLSERLELPNDQNFMKAHFSSYNDTSSNIALHKAFFWSLLKVNLQSDPNLFANGIIFRPDVNEFPIKLSIQSKKNGDEEETENAKEINNSTIRPFCPYIFRSKPNLFTARSADDFSSSNSSNESTNKNQTSQFSYVNLSGLRSFEQRIIPNPSTVRLSDAQNVKDSLQERANNLLQLRDSLYNKKQSDPYSNTYSYSSDWYLHHANKYLNQPFNYHDLTKLHLTNTTDQGFWTVPYLDCSTTGTWLISFSVPFFGLAKSSNQIEFK